MIDGGQGQVGAARQALTELGLHEVELLGLAKREELLIREDGQQVRLSRHDPALQLLQRVRDEAHRFAVTYQRNLRGKAMTQSRLEEVPGVGMKRRQALLKHFGSIDAIRNAEIDEIAAVPGMTRQVAKRVKEML